MPENPTAAGEDDTTPTTAAATANSRGEEGGFSPHSTTTSTPTTGTSRRNKMTTTTTTTTAVLEQDTPPGSSESSPEMTMSSTLPLKQCLAAAIKLSASVSRHHAERTLHLTADLLVGLVEPDEFQRLVTDLIRLPIRPLLQPILAEKQITWLRKEIAQLARHRQLTTANYVREHVKDLLSLSSDCDDEADNSAAEDQETAVPLIWRRKEKIQEEEEVEEDDADDEEQQLQLLKGGDLAPVAPTATSRKRRASTSVAEKGGLLASVVEAADLSMGTPKRAHHQASSLAAMETTRKNLSVSSSSVWMPPKVVAGQQLSTASAAASQQQHQHQQQQQSSSSSSLGGLTMKATPSSPPFHQGDEEWANIHTMLNCILSMVEKTRRALAILQQRSYDHNTSSSAAAVVASTSWQKHQQIRRDETSELRRQAGELIAQTIKATEDRVIQVKRKAEEAVHDVRRTAMAELQRALSAERLRAERLAAEARRQGAEETLLALGRHSQAKEVCWNCGRRAAETCSGCNIARYCSTFCQHKHWEVHHKICGRVSQLMMAATGTGPVEAHQDSTSTLLSHRSSESRSSKSPSPVSANREGSAPFVH